jgi:hypothetical protein
MLTRTTILTSSSTTGTDEFPAILTSWLDRVAGIYPAGSEYVLELRVKPSTAAQEGNIGPSPAQYGLPHLYARDITSATGNCICSRALNDRLHTALLPEGTSGGTR